LKHKCSKIPANSGFSLLEVLVAFTLLAIAMAVLMQIFSRGVNGADIADRYAKAAMMAESKLATVGLEEVLVEGDTTGQFDEDYQWALSVRLYSTMTEPISRSTLETSAIANAEATGTPLPIAAANTNTGAQTALGNIDVDANMFVRLYEIELRVTFKSDDGRERVVTLNTMKIGPRV
jgi:prepilin-type N-terminal cleavage/methylation domain-containing protein